MQTSAIMLRIGKDAQMATGDLNDPGVILDVPSNSVWIRQEDPTNATPDPGDYFDDIWVSYTMFPATYTLYRCAFPAGVSPSACTASDEQIGKLVSIAAAAVIDDTLGVQDFYYEVTLTNRYDPAALRDTFDNPEYALTSRFSPISSSY